MYWSDCLFCLYMNDWNFFGIVCFWIFFKWKNWFVDMYFLKGIYWAYWFGFNWSEMYWVIIEVLCEIGKLLDLCLSFFTVRKIFFVYSLHFTFTKKSLTSLFFIIVKRFLICKLCVRFFRQIFLFIACSYCTKTIPISVKIIIIF